MTEIRGRWNCRENKCHINFLELQATFFCLKAFCKSKTRLHVLLKLDNTTDVAYINKKGGNISASSNKLAKDIWNWAKGQDIWITASNVLGGKYTTADFRSRLFYDNLFANRLNTKCSKYASCKPDPDAYHVNAFSMCWLNLNSYTFLPFSIVGKRSDDSLGDSSLLANTAVVPTICAVGETRDNTTVDTSTSTPAPATRNKLATPNLGSTQSGSSNFVRHLPTAGLSLDVAQIIRHHGGSANSQHTTHQCDDGWTSATDGTLIPTNQL